MVDSSLSFPNVKFIVKADDDMYVRLHLIENYVKKYAHFKIPLILGKFRESVVIKNSSHSNYDEFYPAGNYPTFPVGSFGRIENIYWARYVIKYSDNLFNYPGEDTAVGIWMDEADNYDNGKFRDSIRYVDSIHFQSYYQTPEKCQFQKCDKYLQPKNYDKVIMGHMFTPEMLWECYQNDLKHNNFWTQQHFKNFHKEPLLKLKPRRKRSPSFAA